MKRIFTLIAAALALLLVSTVSIDAYTGISIDNQTKEWNVTVQTNNGHTYQVPAGSSVNDCQSPKVNTWTIYDERGNHFVFPVNFSGEIQLNTGETYHISSTTVSIVIIDDSVAG